MKFSQFHIISLAIFLGLAACRSERKTAGNSPIEKTEPKSVSSPSPPQPEPYGNGQSSVADPEPPPENPSKVKDHELSSDEMMRRIDELKRADLFNVPISVQAAKDRAEAWEKLTSPDPHAFLIKEQYLYAQELLDRYREAPAIEKLVFWRLLNLRLYEQGVSNMSMVVGDNYGELRRGMYTKLKAMLYSALGENPDVLPDFLATRKAMEMLKAASPSGSLFDY
jgi:hypothetical protein